MSPPGWRLLPLLCALVLAGCVGTEEPQVLAPSAPALDSVDQGPSGDGNLTPAAAPPDVTPAPRLLSTPLSWNGSLGTAACVPSGPDACIMPVDPEDQGRFDLAAPATPRRLSATMTWTPASPLTEDLVFGAYVLTSCGEGCVEAMPVADPLVGPSPLALDVNLPALAEGESFVLLVGQPRLTPSPVYAMARAEQAFTVEGVVESMG